MAVVYIDEAFVLDALADLFLLTVTARLAGTRPRWGRLLLASGIGGVYAAAALLPGWGFLSTAPVSIAMGVGIALAAFGGEADLFRPTVLFFAVSCGFAGLVMAMGPLWRDGTGPGRLVWPALVLVLMASLRRRGGRSLAVRSSVGGQISELTALWDSGNGLREDGLPVLVAGPGCIRLPEGAAAVLDGDRLRDPASAMGPLMRVAPGLRPRLAPYRAVGVDAGMLLTIESDWVEIDGARWPRLRVALSPTGLGEGHQALWGGPAGGQRREGGRRHVEDLGDVPGGGDGAPAGRHAVG